MKYIISPNGYYYKEYKNGKKMRVSKKTFDKNNKVLQKGGTNQYKCYTLQTLKTYISNLLRGRVQKTEYPFETYPKPNSPATEIRIVYYNNMKNKKEPVTVLKNTTNPFDLFSIKNDIYILLPKKYKLENYDYNVHVPDLIQDLIQFDKYLSGEIPLYILKPYYKVSFSNKNSLFNKNKINIFIQKLITNNKKTVINSLIKTKIENKTNNSYNVVVKDDDLLRKNTQTKIFSKNKINKIVNSIPDIKKITVGVEYKSINAPVSNAAGTQVAEVARQIAKFKTNAKNCKNVKSLDQLANKLSIKKQDNTYTNELQALHGRLNRNKAKPPLNAGKKQLSIHDAFLLSYNTSSKANKEQAILTKVVPFKGDAAQVQVPGQYSGPAQVQGVPTTADVQAQWTQKTALGPEQMQGQYSGPAQWTPTTADVQAQWTQKTALGPEQMQGQYSGPAQWTQNAAQGQMHNQNNMEHYYQNEYLSGLNRIGDKRLKEQMDEDEQEYQQRLEDMERERQLQENERYRLQQASIREFEDDGGQQFEDDGGQQFEDDGGQQFEDKALRAAQASSWQVAQGDPRANEPEGW